MNDSAELLKSQFAVDSSDKASEEEEEREVSFNRKRKRQKGKQPMTIHVASQIAMRMPMQ